MAQQLTPTHRHLTVLARQLASGLACLVFQCKWSLCLGLPIVELHAQFNISHKENHNKTTYNQWYISCFLVHERLFLSSNLTRESQGCLRVTLQQILVPRGGDHFVQRHECSWCKNRGPRLETKKVTILVLRTYRFVWSRGIKTEWLWRREWELPNTVARYTHEQRALCHTSLTHKR